MNTRFKCMIVAVAVVAAASTALSAKNAGVKAQIASERKGNTKVFEEARAATVAKTWKSPNGGKLPYRLHVLAIWAFHGSKDKAVPVCRSRDMVAAIKAAGGKKILYREYDGLGHNVWTPTFSDDKVFEWLFSQRLQKTTP